MNTPTSEKTNLSLTQMDQPGFNDPTGTSIVGFFVCGPVCLDVFLTSVWVSSGAPVPYPQSNESNQSLVCVYACCL